MRMIKMAAAAAALCGMMASASAVAQSTRSAAAVATTQKAAPVSGVRGVTALQGASRQSEGGVPAVAIAVGAAAAIGLGIWAAVDEEDDRDSNG